VAGGGPVMEGLPGADSRTVSPTPPPPPLLARRRCLAGITRGPARLAAAKPRKRYQVARVVPESKAHAPTDKDPPPWLLALSIRGPAAATALLPDATAHYTLALQVPAHRQ